ncbi:IS3 family transposase [Pseudomonas syringae]|uniref:IS3 family transposase n=1 Tax=Pseudomonas syringae TaxID=317 RepID=UPI00124ABE76|nr:IS3 family transposase [Pseudomonas syringae]MCK9700000.1 IS3 family transposase [Pseudomonas syringae pv. syringae]MCK9755126.1 IS3 family transposase [Pseudomonas syringae pv. syringae]MCK9770188.1 IS3 family transposase [Pseudomonas syringae pv. syringae]MDU8574779.1 IS3 family transposase [Pseudomonas syringae]TRN84446.1 IS3 family transposase [Pseudomonas syringae]
MSNPRYPEEFKIQAVNQVTEKKLPVADVAVRLGVSPHSLYAWIKHYSKPQVERQQDDDQHAELRRLRAELKRVTEERDILKKGRSVLCQGVRLKYAFIKQRAGDYSIRRLCLTLKVHPSGYYAWLSEPQSARAKDDQRLLGLIKHSWLESGGVYGYRKIHDDLREVGEDCGRHRVARLMRLEGLRSQTGYRRRPGKYGGKPAVASPNLLKREFDVVEPNKVWVTDITYIRTYEGWLYLAVVLDLFSRQVVGWSMKSQMTSDLAIDALLIAVWRRKPKQEVMVHSDQGSQYSSSDWRSFLKANNLVASMSRRGNCHDNAVAESFFQLLKRERIKRKIYTSRQDARSDVFDYIEMFYSPKRRHGFNNQLSPVEFEKRYAMSLQGV